MSRRKKKNKNKINKLKLQAAKVTNYNTIFNWKLVCVFVFIVLICIIENTTPDLNRNQSIQNFDPNAPATILTQKNETPAFAKPQDLSNYSLYELSQKSVEEKAKILEKLTSSWSDIWEDNYDYAIIIAQKLIEKNNYNKNRNYFIFIPYHLYDCYLKCINDKNYEEALIRLEQEHFDLYREAALASIPDSEQSTTNEYEKSIYKKENLSMKKVRNLTYEYYDRFVDNDFSPILAIGNEEKRAFAYAWRIYNGYDGYKKETTTYYQWFQYSPDIAFEQNSSFPLNTVLPEYEKELSLANSMMKYSENNIDSYTKNELNTIRKMNNYEKEELYHSLTSHYLGFRDYELFVDYRILIAQKAFAKGINVKSNDFINYLDEIKAFNYVIALDRVSQPKFNSNIKSEIKFLKDFCKGSKYIENPY